MRVAHTPLLVAVLVLIATVATVSGECAWVMWVNGLADKKAVSHTMVGGYASLSECRGALAKVAEEHRTAGEVVRMDRESAVYTKKDENSMALFVCLPDSADPRRAKGQ